MSNLMDGIRAESMYSRLLFIVGNARTGTSIVANILNMSEKIFLMEEANLFIHLTKTDFPRWFNQLHRQTGTPPRKGTFVSPFEGEGETGLSTLQRLVLDYELVGDKIAFGPHGTYDGRSQQEYCFTEHSKLFVGSRYILTSRNPYQSYFSMVKMFRDKNLEELLLCWLESLRYAVIFYTWFPNCRMVFSEAIGPETFTALGEFLGVEMDIPPQYFADHLRQTSLDAAMEFATSLDSELRDILDRANYLYEELRGIFSPTTLRYVGNEQIFGLIGSMIWRIEEMQAAVRAREPVLLQEPPQTKASRAKAD